MRGLLAYAAEQFALSSPQENGEPLRAHLQAQARGQDQQAWHRLVDGPKLSPHVQHVWNAFADLNGTRSVNGMAIAPITRHDIHAWEQDELVKLEPWERRAILQIDAAYRVAHAPKAKGKGATTPDASAEILI